MRLFVALYPPPEALAHLQWTLRPLHDDGALGLRPTPPERWHLTLAFLGEFREDRLDDLRTRLSRVAGRHPALRLRLAGGGTFPRDPARARVLWVGVEGLGADTDALRRLARSAQAAARRAGATTADRRYRPHLTLARAGRGPADATTRTAVLAAYQGPEFTAGGIVLVRSHLGPRVRHETLDTFPLKQPRDHQA